MKRGSLQTLTGKHWGGITAALACALLTLPAMAQTPATNAPADQSSSMPSVNGPNDRSDFVPFSLALENNPALSSGGLSLPGNNGLQLSLNQPLRIQSLSRSVTGNGRNSRASGSGLSYALNDALQLNGGIVLQQDSGFQALGHIHCQNGTLDAVSYSASNCYFIDDGPNGSGSTIALGASYDLGASTTASLNLFQGRTKSDAPYTPGTQALAAASLLDPFLPSRSAQQPLGADMAAALGGLQSAESEITGLDLQFQVGISTDQAGDMVLGLQLTRVLDSGMEGVFYASPGARNWTIAEPYDSAKLSLDWNKGSFSGGMQTYYRAPVTFLNQNELAGQTTFDVHFTWRAPWNASVSVGASNLLSAGASDDSSKDPALVDPLESIYGRIPYVRYKQDL